jgi:pimeloyl-ACP methyl ester carboxylesterase
MQSVTLPNQVTLPYVEQGDPAGVPVLLLHGFTDSWRSFEGVLPYLPASLHAFALSQRGHGDATRPATGYYPQDFAADLAAFMDTLNLGPAIIVGHSMGSIVAQRFAIDYPDRTLGLVLMGSCSTVRGNPVAVDLWNSVVCTLTDPVDPSFVLEFQRSTLAQPVPQTWLDTVVRESLKVPARVWRAALAALLDTDFSAQLSTIEAPTLVIWGDQDTFFLRREQEALAAAVAGAQLVVYPGAGHGFHWEDPARCAADLVAFIESRRENGLDRECQRPSPGTSHPPSRRRSRDAHYSYTRAAP